ncbi:hypothetical protein D3C81_788120 [compost metagenome]
MPHHRIAAGDPREIAEAASGIAEDFQIFAAFGQRIDQRESQQVRQMTGGGQHFVVMIDIHVLDIRTKLAPETVDRRKGLFVGIRQRRENHLVPAEQLCIGRLDPALLGTSNRVAGHEARRHAAERRPGGTHHITLGAAYIGEHRIAEVIARKLGQHLFHGQDRHSQLDDIRFPAGLFQRLLAAIHHPELDGQASRLGIAVDPQHLFEHTFFAQPLGEGAADQAEPHHHQAAKFHWHDLSHGQAPWSGLPGSGHSLPAGRWRYAGDSAFRSRRPGERSRPRPAAPGRSARHRDRDPRR